MLEKPPLGVMPYLLWHESVCHDPSLAQLRQRFDDVADALERFRLAGWWQPETLLAEVGITYRSGA